MMTTKQEKQFEYRGFPCVVLFIKINLPIHLMAWVEGERRMMI